MIDLCLTETDFQLIKRTWLFANFTTEREKISITWFFHVTARNATPKNIFKSSKKFMFSQKVQSQLSPLIQLLFFVLIINNKMLPFSLCMKQFTSCFPLYIKICGFRAFPINYYEGGSYDVVLQQQNQRRCAVTISHFMVVERII